MALLATSSALAYDESEGPTKEDNGEDDPAVVYRESDVANGKKFSGWSNPLSWHDNGDGDEGVLTMIGKQHKGGNELDTNRHMTDVSEYDDGMNYKYGDFVNVQQAVWVNIKKNKNLNLKKVH